MTEYRYYFIIKEPGFIPSVKCPNPTSDNRYEMAKELIRLNPKAEVLLATITESDLWVEAAEEYIQMRDAYAEMAEYEREVREKNDKILDIISECFGKNYRKNISACIKECEQSGEIKIVDTPRGKKQEENWKSFKFIHVDQWSVGMGGDSFEGYVSIPLPDRKFLQFFYAC